MSLRVAQFLAVLPTALAFVPAGAHLFELPNKVDLPRDAYLTVQSIYAGWAWFGIVDLAALIMNVVLVVRLRSAAPGCLLRHGRCPLLRRVLRDLLHLDVPGQPGDFQLDDPAVQCSVLRSRGASIDTPPMQL